MLASDKPDPYKLELIYVKPKDAPNSPAISLKRKVDPLDSMVINNPAYTPGEETMAKAIPTLSKVKQPDLLFRDIDRTSGIDVGWRRINTLRHYFDFYRISFPENGSLLLLKHSDLKERFPSMYSDIMKKKSVDNTSKIFHFSIPGTEESTLERHKVVSEVYFTKLLSTKAILQKYIDGMMNSIFPDKIAQQDCPTAIKHLLDFLDDKAKLYSITDPETIHTWKNNSLVLRFWVNLLKNPHFILDIDMPYPVESSLSIIAQGLIDSCSTRDEELTWDSPANKLLFAKDTKASRKRVKKYYDDIQNIQQTQYNFNQHLRQMQLTNSPFFVESAIQEIFLRWIAGTSIVGNLMTRLRELKLETQIAKFTQILNLMSDNPTYDDSTII
ncbi:Plexin-A2 [Oopsacas minuta]|uniref:Plexin-A2 n=1 Tax=Oopsacas minuta TaxID=111878 RepID=A0AAV7K1I8_9METZ|nr:Plexin-A2 [Oopsacas minuta]